MSSTWDSDTTSNTEGSTDPTLPEVYGPGAELLRFITATRHIDQRKSQVAVQPQNLISQLVIEFVIKGRKRLIHEQDAGR